MPRQVAPGPRTPAQLSQYAASPLRYGQPSGTVACPLRLTPLRADASFPKRTTAADQEGGLSDRSLPPMHHAGAAALAAAAAALRAALCAWRSRLDGDSRSLGPPCGSHQALRSRNMAQQRTRLLRARAP